MQRAEEECDPIEWSRWKMIGQHSTFRPPRFLPDRPSLPTLTYRATPRIHDPAGHRYGVAFAVPNPEEWRACRDYVYGDLFIFNHG
jgi:hypothetical protein